MAVSQEQEYFTAHGDLTCIAYWTCCPSCDSLKNAIECLQLFSDIEMLLKVIFVPCASVNLQIRRY